MVVYADWHLGIFLHVQGDIKLINTTNYVFFEIFPIFPTKVIFQIHFRNLVGNFANIDWLKYIPYFAKEAE